MSSLNAWFGALIPIEIDLDPENLSDLQLWIKPPEPSMLLRAAEAAQRTDLTEEAVG